MIEKYKVIFNLTVAFISMVTGICWWWFSETYDIALLLFSFGGGILGAEYWRTIWLKH